LHHHDVKKWVALDDSPDYSIKHLVLVDPNKALTIEDIKKAERFFKPEHDDVE
jgi:hypothetical protein